MCDPEKAKLFRQHAAEVLCWAEQAEPEEQRRRLLNIAAMYHLLARHFEQGMPATP